jgi:hypothetical protein
MEIKINKKKTKFEIEREKAEAAVKETNDKIGELGFKTSDLYDKLTSIQDLFDAIRNMPSDEKLEYERLKNIRLDWKQQAEKIENDYDKAALKEAGAGAGGAALGVGIVALGPTAAMGIATTFGVASTGTAFSTLSGAAATNAAVAWLGGGALAAGGGGMAAGEAFLALAGPVGWSIAGVAIVGSGILFLKSQNDKKKLEKIFVLISERDEKRYKLATVELEERIDRIVKEATLLYRAISDIKTFGLDYSQMTEQQQYALGSYINLMNSSTQLLVNPILGLIPKYSDEDLETYLDSNKAAWTPKYKKLVVFLANLLYSIDTDKKDKELLAKSFSNNKEFLETMDISKKAIGVGLFDDVEKVLKYKYS